MGDLDQQLHRRDAYRQARPGVTGDRSPSLPIRGIAYRSVSCGCAPARALACSDTRMPDVDLHEVISGPPCPARRRSRRIVPMIELTTCRRARLGGRRHGRPRRRRHAWHVVPRRVRLAVADDGRALPHRRAGMVAVRQGRAGLPPLGAARPAAAGDPRRGPGDDVVAPRGRPLRVVPRGDPAGWHAPPVRVRRPRRRRRPRARRHGGRRRAATPRGTPPATPAPPALLGHASTCG